MKRFICLVLLMCFCLPIFAVEMDRNSEFILATERLNKEIKAMQEAEKIACLIAGAINLSLALWGFNQNSGYGNVTGLLFSFRFGNNIYEAVYK